MTNSDNSSTITIAGLRAEGRREHEPELQPGGPGLLRRPWASRSCAAATSRRPTAQGTPKVAVVNETLRARLLPGPGPARAAASGASADKVRTPRSSAWCKDGKSASLREEPQRFVYLPYAQQDTGRDDVLRRARRATPEALFGARARRRAPRGPRAAGDQAQDHAARRSASRSSWSGWWRRSPPPSALLATLLAALGLYGVMAYAVALRTREIGIRMALGAAAPRRHDDGAARRGHAGGPRASPSACRAATASAASIETQLFGLNARDPLTFAAATAALLLAALLAGYLPARRATRVDPLVALRARMSTMAVAAHRPFPLPAARGASWWPTTSRRAARPCACCSSSTATRCARSSSPAAVLAALAGAAAERSTCW